MTGRAHIVILIGGAVLLFALLALPTLRAHEAALARLHGLQQQTNSLAGKAAALASLRQSGVQAQRQPKGTFFSLVESIASTLDMRGAVKSIKPSSMTEEGASFERVSITASGLYQQQGVAFLHALENSGPVRIESLSIRRSKDNLWDMTLTARRPKTAD